AWFGNGTFQAVFCTPPSSPMWVCRNTLGLIPNNALNSLEKWELSENPQPRAILVMESRVLLKRHLPYCRRSMRCRAAGDIFRDFLKRRSSCLALTPT